MWVASELAHLLVNLDPLIRGETGTSLIELNIYSIGARRAFTYWSALGAMFAILAIVFWLLRSPLGAAIQAIRDNEEAAESVGVRVASAKRLVFTLAAFGAALAGALWVATALTFQPKAYFSPLWTAYMIFMALVGGLDRWRANSGRDRSLLHRGLVRQRWSPVSGRPRGDVAGVCACFAARHLGLVEDHSTLRLLPIGYRLRFAGDGFGSADRAPANHPGPKR